MADRVGAGMQEERLSERQIGRLALRSLRMEVGRALSCTRKTNATELWRWHTGTETPPRLAPEAG
jgi:hypothetical protein